MMRRIGQNIYDHEKSHWWFVGRRKIIFSMLDKYLPAVKGQLRLLDVGCGTGVNLKRLEKYGHATGVDIVEEAVKFSRLRNCKDVLKIDKGILPFNNNTFDVITVLDVIEHVDDDYAALCDYYRVMKDEGILLITVPAHRFLWGAHDVAVDHRRRYVARDLKNKVEKAGFAVKKLTYFETFFFPFVLLGRIKEKFAKNVADNSSPVIRIKDRPYFINRLLGFMFSLEARFLEGFDFRCGVLLLCAARKSTIKTDIVVQKKRKKIVPLKEKL